jgi:hypothetical protein
MVPVDCAGIAVETRPLAAGCKTERGAVCHKPDRITGCDRMANDRLVCQILFMAAENINVRICHSQMTRAERRGPEE